MQQAMLITDNEAKELKTWVIKKLEDMYADTPKISYAVRNADDHMLTISLLQLRCRLRRPSRLCPCSHPRRYASSGA